LNQTNVVERTGIDRSTLAEIVSRLMRKGLLEGEGRISPSLNGHLNILCHLDPRAAEISPTTRK
jgi:DNA-binding IclR family transcriptional regulator